MWKLFPLSPIVARFIKYFVLVETTEEQYASVSSFLFLHPDLVHILSNQTKSSSDSEGHLISRLHTIKNINFYFKILNLLQADQERSNMNSLNM